jgi:hypothetical protein
LLQHSHNATSYEANKSTHRFRNWCVIVEAMACKDVKIG